ISNSPPAISSLPYTFTSPMNVPANVPLTVSDLETPVTNLAVTAFSANTNRVPNGNLVVTGSGANRVLSLLPATNQIGTTTINVVVTDSLGARSTNSIILNVYQFVETPASDLPGLFYSSAAWGDFDEDGLLDLALVGSDTSLTSRTYLFHNNGDG